MDTEKPSILLGELADWVQGSCRGDLPPTCCGLTQDSRKIAPGMVYVALKGERFDGHRFVGDALGKGAAAALVSTEWKIPPELDKAPLIRVGDPLKALSEAARIWRRHCRARIVGLTGSVGKTTTKELTAACLGADGRRVCATRGNLNNAIGLPLSLLTLTEYDDFGVFETGTNHPGEILHLARILEPEAAILTNIGTAHIEHFHSREAIAEEKSTLLAHLPEDGFAVLPRETACMEIIRRRSRARLVTVSLESREADYSGEVADPATGRLRIFERENGEVTEVSSGLPGAHHAADLLLAFATAREAGIQAGKIPAALKGFTLPGMRWSKSRYRDITFINDAYNANPQSMLAALDTLSRTPTAGRRVAVVGDMLELGEFSGRFHREVGERAARCGLDLLVTVGGESRRHTAEGALKAGFPASRIQSFDRADPSTREALLALLRPGDTVLLKASRGVALEKLLPEKEGE